MHQLHVGNSRVHERVVTYIEPKRRSEYPMPTTAPPRIPCSDISATLRRDRSHVQSDRTSEKLKTTTTTRTVTRYERSPNKEAEKRERWWRLTERWLLVEVAKQDKEQDEEEQEGRKRKKQKATTGLVEWYLLAFITCIITFALSLFVLISFHNTPAYFYLHRPLTCTFVNNCISHSLTHTL
jgi:hypothetical protein